MPQINRIRVNNVKYNFGTQFYDDFIMRFSGKNTIYDLANGGGKSVLMLLLLQNMIPNCTLDDKQPVEKLFRTGNGSSTIHSLVEWNLSDVHVKNNYRYMLTGFCARKARDEDKEDENSTAIDYFNYVIFYREYNDNDIKNLPLSVPSSKNPKGKERITYNGLKNYLRNLEKKDLSLEVRIFEKKGDYQRFIAGYGIYESEWEIIRGINKTEGHVRTYFETNYKTTRKVVEDLLIEEIIEKSFKNRVLGSEGVKKHENEMVETLIEIKDKLLELSAKKEDIHNYDQQMELLENFIERVSGMKKFYFGQESMEKELVSGYHSLRRVMDEDAIKRDAMAEELRSLEKRKQEENKACETVKIQENSVRAEKLAHRLKERKEEEKVLEKESEDLRRGLTLAESMNDYLDYLYYKKERDIVRENIERIAEDKGELLRKLEQLAQEKKKRDGKLFEEIHARLEEEEEKEKKEQEIAEELKNRREVLVKDITIADYKIAEYEKKVNECNEKIAALKHSDNLLMVYDMEKELSLNCEKIEEMVGLAAENDEKIADNIDGQKEMEIWTVSLKSSIEELEEKLEKNIDIRKSLTVYQERVEKLKAVYGEKDSTGLYWLLKEKLETSLSEKDRAEEEKREKDVYLRGLREGCPVGSTEAVEKVLTYVNRFHDGVAVSGKDVLSAAAMEERQGLLERVPMLPYAVIIRDRFASVSEDTGLKNLQLGNYAVPLIDERVLKDGDYLINDNIALAMCRKELFFDEKVMAGEISRVEHRILELEHDIERLADHIEVYGKDSGFMEEFVTKYQIMIEEKEEEYNSLRLELREKETLLKQKAEEKELRETSGKVLAEERERLAEQLEMLRRRAETVESIMVLAGNAAEYEKIAGSAYSEKQSAGRELSNVVGRLEAWQSKAEANKKIIENLKATEETVRADWEKYRRYYKEEFGEKGQEYEELTDDELEAKFAGIAGAFEGGNGDIADKQKLLDNYEVAMEKSLQAIEYKGVRVSEIREKHSEGAWGETVKEELLELKRKIEEKESELRSLREEMAKLQSEKDRLEGAVVHGREAIIEKYGTFENIDLNYISADEFLREKQQIITVIDKKEEDIKAVIKCMENAGKRYEMLLHDMDRVLTEKLLEKYEKEYFEVDENICERVEKAIGKFEHFRSDILDRKEEFEQEKSRMVNILRQMKCSPLADEINSNAVMPESVKETDILMESFREIITCLKLEKDRISKSIQDMKMIKDNFESQCIQSCVNIKTELEKLPNLSKIVMDGESIPMISLNIPYRKEEEYRECMAAYIDETVEQADTMQSEAERVKFIKSRLSWKRLFAVIVTDMNAIRLKLYKRESVKEQSRYLRYEEAVGSTGQSQGIYIQFLIGVINYISSINSRDTDSTSLRKVIFIDNPFGAAKDIYIWEPIFKMLKTNNVQLIVPCRGATPAITGRFDVNYVLGQKFIDGRQQTVVVDYYSNVDSDKLDYTTMTYEQGSLDFLS